MPLIRKRKIQPRITRIARIPETSFWCPNQALPPSWPRFCSAQACGKSSVHELVIPCKDKRVLVHSPHQRNARRDKRIKDCNQKALPVALCAKMAQTRPKPDRSGFQKYLTLNK